MWPRHFTFRKAGVLVALLSIVTTPWNLFANPAIVNHFIGDVGALMGPVYGIIMADYYLVKRQIVDQAALFDDRPSGRYCYASGYNSKAIYALLASGLVTICLTIIPVLNAWAPFSWPFVVLIGAVVYCQLIKVSKSSLKTAPAG